MKAKSDEVLPFTGDEVLITHRSLLDQLWAESPRLEYPQWQRWWVAHGADAPVYGPSQWGLSSRFGEQSPALTDAGHCPSGKSAKSPRIPISRGLRRVSAAGAADLAFGGLVPNQAL